MNVFPAIDAWLDRPTMSGLQGPFVVAVSGGMDSSVLVLALVDALRRRASERTVVLAHVDHGIRAVDHERVDAEVVRDIAGRTGVVALFGRVPQDAFREGSKAGGREAEARAERYRILTRVCESVGSSILVTAHHADDQAETVLMRLLAGMSGSALAGIPRTTTFGAVRVERPLLEVPREQIKATAELIGAPWNDDVTNDDRSIRRNRVRHEILPALRREWPAISRDLCVVAASMSRRNAEIDRRLLEIRVFYTTTPSAKSGVRQECAEIDRGAFFNLSADERLRLLYRVSTHLRLIDRGDRPGHRFFAPLLSADPGHARTLIAARGIRVALRARSVVVGPDIVRAYESGYLR